MILDLVNQSLDHRVVDHVCQVVPQDVVYEFHLEALQLHLRISDLERNGFGVLQQNVDVLESGQC